MCSLSRLSGRNVQTTPIKPSKLQHVCLLNIVTMLTGMENEQTAAKLLIGTETLLNAKLPTPPTAAKCHHACPAEKKKSQTQTPNTIKQHFVALSFCWVKHAASGGQVQLGSEYIPKPLILPERIWPGTHNIYTQILGAFKMLHRLLLK